LRPLAAGDKMTRVAAELHVNRHRKRNSPRPEDMPLFHIEERHRNLEPDPRVRNKPPAIRTECQRLLRTPDLAAARLAPPSGCHPSVDPKPIEWNEKRVRPLFRSRRRAAPLSSPRTSASPAGLSAAKLPFIGGVTNRLVARSHTRTPSCPISTASFPRSSAEN